LNRKEFEEFHAAAYDLLVQIDELGKQEFMMGDLAALGLPA
jgi:hypothetical protein